MTSKKYTYDSRNTRKRERVNVWQLNKTVKALELKVQVLERHVAHQVGLNAQQVLLNESLHDRVAELETARWRNPVKYWFKKWVDFVTGK
ncbi:hypothetical protein [Rodentibacter pneumotropicus]|uniref:hypothetical protein n=1 Tax=Rodentibacter pneumotropicus TaxID=758 RepID=UPI00098555E2|nr:hypothetical protein [Rodentibacter pneumotropicus]OOF64784.1 hypothetical protein BKL50_00825 [Rodentibacter pneumotropicus]THA16964.1 hypothetical protein D3M83_08895 [Rodentibacter pneumotropicus]